MAFLTRRFFAGGVAAALTAWGVAEAFLATAGAASSTSLVNTQAVHAAFTLNLTRFVAWPEGTFAAPDAPLVIGTFPRDPINEHLDAAVQGESAEGRPLRTVRIQSLAELANCHVVFVSKTVSSRSAVLTRVARKPILVVSDAEGFLELGGHVRFVSQPPHTRLQISPENLKESGLEAKAQLLRLAKTP